MNTSFRRLFVITFLLVAGGSPIAANAQTLDDFIYAALETHPQIDRAKADIDAAREDLPQARAQFRSQLTFQSSISATDRNARLADGQSFDDTTSPYSYSLRLNRPLYTNGLKPAALRRAYLSGQIANDRFQETELQLALDVSEAYFSVVEAQETLKIQIEINRLIYDQIEAAEQRFALDVGTITEVLQVESRYATSNADITIAQSNLEQARRRLERLSGLPVEELDTPDLPELPADTLEEMVLLAKRASPSLSALRRQYDQARLGIVVADRQDGPRLDATLQASRARDTSPAIERDDDVRATLSLTFPLLDGGASQSRRRQARAEANSVLAALREQEDQIETYVSELWLQLDAVEEELAALEQSVSASEATLEGVIAGQQAGIWSVQDTLDANEALLNSLIARISVRMRRRALIHSLLLIAASQ